MSSGFKIHGTNKNTNAKFLQNTPISSTKPANDNILKFLNGVLVPTQLQEGNFNSKKNNFEAIVDPAVTDDENNDYSVGSIWVNTVSQQSYICIDSTAGSALWDIFGFNQLLNTNSNVTFNQVAVNDFSEFSDITSPNNPGDGKGRLYKKTGNDGIWWKPDSSGQEVDLTESGTVAEFTGATGVADGTSGIVPAPLATQQNNILLGTGLWTSVSANSLFDMFGNIIKDWQAPADPVTVGGLTLTVAQWVELDNNYFIRLINAPSQISNIYWNAGTYENFRFEVSIKILDTSTPADIIGFYANATVPNPQSENNTGGLTYYTDYYNGGNYIHNSTLNDGATNILQTQLTGLDNITGNYYKFSMTRYNNFVEILHESDDFGIFREKAFSPTFTTGPFFGIYGRTGTNFMNVEIKNIRLTVL